MDVLLLTGAGTEPAQSIARRMVAIGFRVYGFDASFPAAGFTHADFVQVLLNIADAAAVRDAVAKIFQQETGASALILTGYYPVETLLEATHEEDISFALNAALTTPLLLARAALPSLIRRKGCLISITRRAHLGGKGTVLSSVIEGALRRLAGALFEELRDTGLKAAHLCLEGNAEPEIASASLGNAAQSLVHPEIVADTVEFLIKLRENNALTELVLRPQATREEPRIPISSEPRLRAIQNIILPTPQDFPPEEALILTPKQQRPDYAPPVGTVSEDDSDDDSDNSVDPELLYLIRPSRSQDTPEKAVSAGNSVEPASRKNRRQDKNQVHPQGREAQSNRRSNQPKNGALRIHPHTPPEVAADQQPHQQRLPHQHSQLQAHALAPAQQQAPIYPENWHGPRPPTRRQLERAEWFRRRQDRRAQWEQRGVKDFPNAPAPKTAKAGKASSQEPVPEFVPPPPCERPSSDIPHFIPPVPAARFVPPPEDVQPTHSLHEPSQERPATGNGMQAYSQEVPLSPSSTTLVATKAKSAASIGRKSASKKGTQARSTALLRSCKPATRRKNISE